MKYILHWAGSDFPAVLPLALICPYRHHPVLRYHTVSPENKIADFVNGRSKISYDEFRAFDAIQHYNMMVESIRLILDTKYPKIFFYRYRFAIEKAEIVCGLDKTGSHGKNAQRCLVILRKNKTDLVNAFLTRCFDAGKLLIVKDEILAERSNIPKESYEYFCQLLMRSADRK